MARSRTATPRQCQELEQPGASQRDGDHRGGPLLHPNAVTWQKGVILLPKSPQGAAMG